MCRYGNLPLNDISGYHKTFSGSIACSTPISPTSKKWAMPMSLQKSRHILHCSAALMSLFGAKWSMTIVTLFLSNTLSRLSFRYSEIATGDVISFPSTRSRLTISVGPPPRWEDWHGRQVFSASSSLPCRYTPSFDKIYSNESTKARKLASIISLDTPIVVQLSLPLVDSISTLVLAPVLLLESITLTL